MAEEKNEGRDIFVANRTYPDAKGLFFSDYRSLQEIRHSCVVVLDTTALLVPYGISKNSLSQIASAYRSLANENRLVIPGQVAREFARNRPLKIAEIFQDLSRKQGVSGPRRARYPLLEDDPIYVSIQDLGSRIDKLIEDYRDAVGTLLKKIQAWNWNDPVSELYSRIFPDAVLDLPLNEEEPKQHLEYQKINKIPPGYKDAAKSDSGIGDQLVWQVVVHVAPGSDELKLSVPETFPKATVVPSSLVWWWHGQVGKRNGLAAALGNRDA